jgi:hypothetical protein
MPKYGVSAAAFTTPTGTADTAILVHANAAGEQCEIVELIMTGSGSTGAADTQHRAAAYYHDGTTAGTAGSNPTPEKFADGSAAAACLAGIAYTAEPTNINTVAILQFGFNQRGGMRYAVPQGEGIKCMNSFTEKGVVWTVVSSVSGSIDANMHWWE